MAHEAGVLSEENIQEIERNLKLNSIVHGGDSVSCVPFERNVASAVCYEGHSLKSILRKLNNFETTRSKTPNTVRFASPIMSVFVIEETEDDCSEDTVILSTEDAVIHYQEVPEFSEESNEENYQESPPWKKMKPNEGLLTDSDPENNITSRSFKRWPSFYLPDGVEMGNSRDIDISSLDPCKESKDNTYDGFDIHQFNNSETSTKEFLNSQESEQERNEQRSLSDSKNYTKSHGKNPSSTKQVQDDGCANTLPVTANEVDNMGDVQVVPEHFSVRTATCINPFHEEAAADIQLKVCPSFLPLGEGAFIKEVKFTYA